MDLITLAQTVAPQQIDIDATQIAIAIIGVVASIAGALVAAGRRVAQIEVKVDVLWKVWVVDAVSDARKNRMIESNSPEMPTEKWDAVVPDELKNEIISYVAALARRTKEPYTITRQVVQEYIDEFVKITENNEDPTMLKQLIGTVHTIVHRHLDIIKT